MTSMARLNLVGILSPLCLLECKKALNRLQSGEKITIRLDDSFVLKDLITIVERSEDRILSVSEKADYCQIAIQKK